MQMREAERKKTIVVPRPDRVTHAQISREQLGRNPVLGTAEANSKHWEYHVRKTAEPAAKGQLPTREGKRDQWVDAKMKPRITLESSKNKENFFDLLAYRRPISAPEGEPRPRPPSYNIVTTKLDEGAVPPRCNSRLEVERPATVGRPRPPSIMEMAEQREEQAAALDEKVAAINLEKQKVLRPRQLRGSSCTPDENAPITFNTAEVLQAHTDVCYRGRTHKVEKAMHKEREYLESRGEIRTHNRFARTDEIRNAAQFARGYNIISNAIDQD